MPRGIDLHSQPSFGEVDLNRMGPFLQAAPYLGFMLAQQIVDELLARIIWNALGWVHQTQGRGRYHRLLDRYMRVADSDTQVTVCVPHVTESAAGEPAQSASGAVSEGNIRTSVDGGWK